MKKNAAKGVAVTTFLLILGAAAAQYFLHVFDAPLEEMYAYLSAADKILLDKLILGISIGTLILVAALLIIPVLAKDINTKAYFKYLYQGILSSLIFYLSESVYAYLETAGRLYLLGSIFIVALLAEVLIHILAGMHRRKEAQVEFKTASIAGVAAGLIFGLLLQFGRIGFEMLKTGLRL